MSLQQTCSTSNYQKEISILPMAKSKCFFLVLARDENHVEQKINELENLGFPFIVVCGEHVNHCKVVYREAKGKYDAINFGLSLVPKDAEIVAMNDVDTEIHNVEEALGCFESKDVGLVFGRVQVRGGPQKSFYQILDPIRTRIQINSSGELMFVRRSILDSVLPMRSCKAEDSHIMFRALEQGKRVIFCKSCYSVTDRTEKLEDEEKYKRRTVCGIYQALNQTSPPYSVRVFYFALPFIAPILLVTGKKGYFWMKGIILGVTDHLRGDCSGVWKTTYLPQEYIKIENSSSLPKILPIIRRVAEEHVRN